MPLPDTWTEQIIVRPYEADFQGRWKPASFFQAMQVLATHHATHLGLGYQAMLHSNLLWVLARLKLAIKRFPLLGGEVTLQTWPRGTQQKIFFTRDFFFFNAKGEKIAAATSAWLLVNAVGRHILKPNQNLPADLPLNTELSALDEPLEKIEVPEDMIEIHRVEARYSDTDILRHVNNTRYIEWISDCFSLDDYQARNIQSIQVNYANEVKPGERISIARGRHPSQTAAWVVQGTNLSTGLRAFEALLTWSEK